MKSCYLCGSKECHNLAGKVRDNDQIQILECEQCGLVYLSNINLPAGFYEQSGMHGNAPQSLPDWLRLSDRDDDRRFRYLKELITNRDVLDFGCGAGGFMLKAKQITHKIMGIEIEMRLKNHFNDNNLEVFQNIEDIPITQKFDIITAFHVIEHLEDPSGVLNHLSTKLRKESLGEIIIEVPSSSDALLRIYENPPFSEFTYWSCHPYLFNSSNLPLLAKKAGLKIRYCNHIQRYPLSNHLYWLAKGQPGGHKQWSFLDSDSLSKAYEERLSALGKTDTLIASLVL
ncbi:MAG: class I SAM-dependent methyltransferase [Candidatus Riflebacteria bacterium]|nr:class I SAM-dependent methyltransferase [Candidatus Riflebacteria bacterium]